MEEFDLTKFHLGLAGVNAGMMGVGLMEGDSVTIGLNAAILPLNLGLAASHRKDEIRSLGRNASDRTLGAVYDSAVQGRVEGEVEEAMDGLEGDYGSRRSERGIC